MAIDRGRNTGITGLCDFGGGAPKFTVSVRAFKRKLTSLAKPRNGRGTGRWSKSRHYRPGGLLVLSGTTKKEGFPLPTEWKPVEGSIVAQFHRTAQETLSVRVIDHEIGIDEKTAQDEWRITIVAEILASPTQAGFDGTQPTASDPTPSNLELYMGLTKTHDPYGILTEATATFEIWPLGDGDAAEAQAIADLVSAVLVEPRFVGAKVKTAVLLPDRDADAGTIQVNLSLTDSVEDIVNPETATTIDPEGLASEANSVGVLDDPAEPGNDLVERGTTTQEINDQRTKTSKKYGTRSTKDDVEMDNTVVRTDATKLESGGQETIVYDTLGTVPTAPTVALPTDVKVIWIDVQKLNRKKSKRIFHLGHRTPKEEIEWLKSLATTEPGALKQAALVVQVTSSATPDASALNPDTTNLSFYTTESHRQTDTQWVHAHLFMPLTPTEEMTAQFEQDDVDPASLEDENTRVLYGATSTPATAPTLAGKVWDHTTVKRVGKVKYRYVYHYGYRTSAQKLVAEKTRATTDPLGLDSEHFTAAIYATGNPPSPHPSAPLAGLQLVEFLDLTTPNPASTLRVYLWGVLNSEQKRGFPRVETTDDLENLRDTAVRYKFFDYGGTAPAAPDDPPTNNVKIIYSQDLRVTPDRSMRLFVYGPRNSRDELVLDQHQTTTDPGGLESTAVRAALDGETISPDPPVGYVPRGTKVVPITDGLAINRTLTVKFYGLRSTVDDVEMPGTVTTADPLAIDSEARDAEVFTTANGEPNDPAPPLGELQVVDTEIEELNRTRSVKRTKFGVLNSRQKRTFPKISTTADINSMKDEAVRAEFWNVSGIAPALPADPPTNNVKLIDHADVPITPIYNMRVWLYGPRDSRDEKILPNTETSNDPQGLETSAIRASLDGEPVPAPPFGLELRDAKEIPITIGLGTNRTLLIWVYGVRSTLQDIEFLQSKAVKEDGQLQRHPVVTRVTANETPDDFNPDPENLSLYWAQSHQHTSSGLWVHAAEYRPLTATEELEEDGNLTVDDPETFLDGDSRRRKVTDSPTPPTTPVIALRFCVKRTIRRVGKKRYQHDWYYDLRSNADKLVAARTRSHIDPHGLTSEAITAEVFLAATPPTEDPEATHPTYPTLKFVDHEDFETPNPLYRLRVRTWGLLTSKERIERPGTIVRFNALDNITSTETTVISNTDDIGTMAEILKETAKSDESMGDFELERLNDDKVRLAISRLSLNEKLKWRTVESGLGLCQTRMDSFGNVQVFVDQIIDRGDGLKDVHISPQYLRYAVIELRISKRRSHENLPFTPSYFGRKNSDAFLGFTPGFVMYMGSEGETERTLDTPHIMPHTDIFRYDSRGIYVASGVVMDWVLTDAGVGIGWNNISAFGWGAGTVFNLDFTATFLDPPPP